MAGGYSSRRFSLSSLIDIVSRMRLHQELESDAQYVTYHSVDHEYECCHWDDEPKYSLEAGGYVINAAFVLDPCSDTEMVSERSPSGGSLYSPIMEIDSVTEEL